MTQSARVSMKRTRTHPHAGTHPHACTHSHTRQVLLSQQMGDEAMLLTMSSAQLMLLSWRHLSATSTHFLMYLARALSVVCSTIEVVTTAEIWNPAHAMMVSAGRTTRHDTHGTRRSDGCERS